MTPGRMLAQHSEGPSWTHPNGRDAVRGVRPALAGQGRQAPRRAGPLDADRREVQHVRTELLHATGVHEGTSVLVQGRQEHLRGRHPREAVPGFGVDLRYHEGAARTPSYDLKLRNNQLMWKGVRAVPSDIVSVDEESLGSDIKSLVRKTVEETLSARHRRGGEDPRRCRASREDGGPGGLHRVCGIVARVLLVAEVSRPLQRPARHGRQVRRHARRTRGGAPGARCQHCTVHLYRNVLGKVPVTKRKAVARMLKAIHAQESREACSRKADEVAAELDGMRLAAAARTERDGFAETLAYADFPPEH